MNYALIFPGQGSQYVGMGKKLCEDNPDIEHFFDKANDILNYDIKQMCFEGPAYELNKTGNALLAIYITSVAAYNIFIRQVESHPIVYAGHSLGEYAALTCAGAIDFEQVLRIIQSRNELSAHYMSIGMMSIVEYADINEIESICSDISSEENPVCVACYNSKDQFVLSGGKDAVKMVGSRLLKRNAKVTPLLFSPPYHSPILKPIIPEFESILTKSNFQIPESNVLAGIKAMPYTHETSFIKNLSSQLISPILWEDCMEKMIEMGAELFIEMGPQSVLTELNKKSEIKIKSYSFLQKNDYVDIISLLGKQKIPAPSKEFYEINILTKCLAAAVSVKNYNDNLDEYEQEAVIPYKKIKYMQENLHKQGIKPSLEQEEEALNMLRSVLHVKKVPKEKSNAIINKVRQCEK